MKKIFLITEGQVILMEKIKKQSFPAFSKKQVEQLLTKNKITLTKFSIEELIKGIKIEFEHGKIHKKTNVTNDNLEKTMKIALAHLNEKPNYYKLLKKYVE